MASPKKKQPNTNYVTPRPKTFEEMEEERKRKKEEEEPVMEAEGEIPIPKDGWPTQPQDENISELAEDFPVSKDMEKVQKSENKALREKPALAHNLLEKAPILGEANETRPGIPLSQIAKLPPGQQPKWEQNSFKGENVDGLFNMTDPANSQTEEGQDPLDESVDKFDEESPLEMDNGLEKIPVNNRYQELKALLDAKRDGMAQQRKDANAFADPMEARAYELDNTEDEVAKTGDNRLYGQLANMVSLGLDKSSQFSDKQFDSGESRRLNTDMSMNLERQLQARQLLANRLRARAQERRLRPAVEGGKYAQTEGLDIANETNREINPIRAMSAQSSANMNDRKDRGTATTFDTDIEEHQTNSRANNSKNETIIDTKDNRKIVSDEGAKRAPMITERMDTDNKLQKNSLTSSDILTADKVLLNNPKSKVTDIVAKSLQSSLNSLARKEMEPARKAELQNLARRIEGQDLTYNDLQTIQRQFPELSVKAALAKAKPPKDPSLKYLSDVQHTAMVSLNSALDDFKDIIESPQRSKTGKWQTLEQWAKGLVGANDPEWTAFAGDVNARVSSYIQGISGAAASDKERANLERQLPAITDSPAVFEAQLKRVFKQLARKRKTFIGLTGVQHKEVIGEPVDPDKYDNVFSVETDGKTNTSKKKEDTQFNATKDGKVDMRDKPTNKKDVTFKEQMTPDQYPKVGDKVGEDLPSELPQKTVQETVGEILPEYQATVEWLRNATPQERATADYKEMYDAWKQGVYNK